MSEKLIPNTFQHPNFYIDQLAYFLTPQENVVLTKAIREILGWQNKIEARKARIALSVFVDGKSNKDGERLCYGCGIGNGAVRKALKGLNRFGILVKGKATSLGQMFHLIEDSGYIDWKGLKIRRAKWDAKWSDQTQAATQASLDARGVTSDVRGNVERQGGVTLDVRGGVTLDVRGGVTLDVNKETHLETQLETQLGAAAPTPIPQSKDEEDDFLGMVAQSEHMRDNPPPRLTSEQIQANTKLASAKARTRVAGKTWLNAMAGRPEVKPRPGVTVEQINQVIYLLSNDFGLDPDWSDKKETSDWVSQCAKLWTACGGNLDTITKAGKKLRESKMTLSGPRSFIKTTRAIAAERRTKPAAGRRRFRTLPPIKE